MNTVNDNGHKWFATYKTIDVTLQDAVEAARQQQAHDSSYSGDTTVDKGPDGYESTRLEAKDGWT